MQHLSFLDTVHAEPMKNWDILPHDWVEKAREMDLKYFN